jgi:hypothetical protein
MRDLLDHVRGALRRHRTAIRRTAVALAAAAASLLVVGGAIRLLGGDDPPDAPLAPSGSPSATWRASLPTAVTGLAVEDGRLYVASDQLTVFPLACVAADGACLPTWRGVVPDGPVSVPTVRDDHVFVGSVDGQLYAFPAECDGQGCPPAWVGLAGDGPVSRPAANFDLVYATSDELYAFPVACADEDRACPAAWSADVPGRPADGAPALGGGLVVVASSSTRGGLAAYPAVCREDCQPAWTGRTDGPATAVAIGDGVAYAVARGSLLAFDMTCRGRCEPVWRGAFLPGAPFAAGASSAPAVADDRVLVGAADGRLWIFPASCDGSRCDPIRSIEVSDRPLFTPSVDGDRAVVTARDGLVARVLLDCMGGDPACDQVVSRTPIASGADAAAVIAPDATVAGGRDGSVDAFRWATLRA